MFTLDSALVEMRKKTAIHRYDSAFVNRVAPFMGTFYQPNMFVLYLDNNSALFFMCQSELLLFSIQNVYLLSRYPVLTDNYVLGITEAVLKQFGITIPLVEVDQLNCPDGWAVPMFSDEFFTLL